MSARRYHVHNPIGQYVGVTKGFGRSEALHRAEVGLSSMREKILGQIDADLGELLVLCEGARGPSSEAGVRLYDLSRQIHATAGLFGLGELGAAAFSLCELVDRMDEAAAWKPAAVIVHMEAMRILRRPHDADEATKILDGLALVVGCITTRPDTDPCG